MARAIVHTKEVHSSCTYRLCVKFKHDSRYCFTCSSGAKYVGHFADGTFHGQGRYLHVRTREAPVPNYFVTNIHIRLFFQLFLFATRYTATFGSGPHFSHVVRSNPRRHARAGSDPNLHRIRAAKGPIAGRIIFSGFARQVHVDGLHLLRGHVGARARGGRGLQGAVGAARELGCCGGQGWPGRAVARTRSAPARAKARAQSARRRARERAAPRAAPRPEAVSRPATPPTPALHLPVGSTERAPCGHARAQTTQHAVLARRRVLQRQLEGAPARRAGPPGRAGSRPASEMPVWAGRSLGRGPAQEVSLRVASRVSNRVPTDFRSEARSVRVARG